MLADSVEAASRSIEQPTPRKLENLVNNIFEARIGDGQLDFCPLTFADINRIRETILSMLSGMHHFRVKYPGQEEDEKAAEAEEAAEFAETAESEGIVGAGEAEASAPLSGDETGESTSKPKSGEADADGSSKDRMPADAE